MEVKIKLEELFVEEGMTTEEAIKKAVIDEIVNRIDNTQKEQIMKESVQLVVNKIMDEKVKNFIETTINDLLHNEYQIITQWGERKEKTSFQKELIKTFTAQMVYKNVSRYESENNFFTNTINKIIEDNVKKFQSEFNSIIDSEILKKAYEYAVEKIKISLKIGGK